MIKNKNKIINNHIYNLKIQLMSKIIRNKIYKMKKYHNNKKNKVKK